MVSGEAMEVDVLHIHRGSLPAGGGLTGRWANLNNARGSILSGAAVRRGRAHLALGVSFALAVCSTSVDVDAAPRKPSKAARRFEKKGKKAYARKRWDDAVAAFKLAYEADPHPRFLFNTARAYDKKGDLERSLEYLVRYVEEETDPEERADGQTELRIVEQRLKESHAPLDLAVEPGDAMVAITGGGRELTMSAPVSRWLKAGTWSVRVTAAGYEPWKRELVLEAGTPVQVEVRLEKEGASAEGPSKGTVSRDPEPGEEPEPEPVEDPAPAAGPPPAQGGGGSLVPWLAMGAGGALLAGGAVFALLAGQSRDERDALKESRTFHEEIVAKQEEAEGRALLANVLLGAGAVAAGTGVVLLLVGGDEAGSASAGRLRPLPLSGGGGLVLEGTH